MLLGLVMLMPAVSGAADAPPATAPARMATLDDLHKMFAAGQYQVCLQQIARLRRMQPKLAGPESYGLILLRADCYLHLNDPDFAQRDYARATKSPDRMQSATGRAMSLLIRKSDNLAYTPRTGEERQPIPIVSEDTRKKALAALFTDTLAANQPAIHKALEAQNLVPIMDVVEPLADVQALELTSSGTDVQVRPVLQGIGERARTLISRELDVKDEQVKQMGKLAGEQVNIGPIGPDWWWRNGSVRRGLHTPERHQLRDLQAYLQKILNAALIGQKYAWALGGDGTKWDPVITHAQEVLQRATSVLEAE